MSSVDWPAAAAQGRDLSRRSSQSHLRPPFAPGEYTKTITVPLIHDPQLDGAENLLVNLTNPANATIALGQAHGIIVDDD